MKTNELTGAALDWAVAKCEGMENSCGMWINNKWLGVPYSTNWAQGGPIIERERFNRMTLNISGGYTVSIKITTLVDTDETFIKWVHGVGNTPLIAAMRCYVASKLGDEVNLPPELLT
jgi:Protein of unknown function (DUF2591)